MGYRVATDHGEKRSVSKGIDRVLRLNSSEANDLKCRAECLSRDGNALAEKMAMEENIGYGSVVFGEQGDRLGVVKGYKMHYTFDDSGKCALNPQVRLEFPLGRWNLETPSEYYALHNCRLVYEMDEHNENQKIANKAAREEDEA